MSELSPAEIAVLASDVRRLTDEVKKLLPEISTLRVGLTQKADAQKVNGLQEKIAILYERENVGQSRDLALKDKADNIESRLTRLEMETWKIGLMLGGSATGGGALALAGQYLFMFLM